MFDYKLLNFPIWNFSDSEFWPYKILTSTRRDEKFVRLYRTRGDFNDCIGYISMLWSVATRGRTRPQ